MCSASVHLVRTMFVERHADHAQSLQSGYFFPEPQGQGLHLCEGSVQDGRAQPCQREPVVNDLDFPPVVVLVDLSAICQPSRFRILVRLVGPSCRTPGGGQMLVGDQFLQMGEKSALSS